MQRMKRIVLMLAVALLFAGVSFAQEAAPAAKDGVGATTNVDPVNWLHYAALLIGGTLVPLGANLLKRAWKDAPTPLKSLMPLIAGSLIAMAEGALLNLLGEPIDLSLITQILMGSGFGAAATMAFKMGETHGASK